MSSGRQQAASVPHSSPAWYLVLGWCSLLSAHIVLCCKCAAVCFRWLVWLDLAASLGSSCSPPICVCVWICSFQANMWAAVSCFRRPCLSVNMIILNTFVLVFACVFHCALCVHLVHYSTLSVPIPNVRSCTSWASILIGTIFIGTQMYTRKDTCEIIFLS